MKHIEINIWKACNNKCKFCMSSKPSLWDIKFVKFDILKPKLESYYNNWYRSVWFLWWDISIYPNIIEIISYCKKIWFIEIQAITNGMIFDDYNFIERVVKAWLTRINISIHSHKKEIEDYLTQVPWCLKRKLKAIDNINLIYKKWLLKSPLSINIVLNKYNLFTIVDTVFYFYKIKKINDIRINFIWLSEDVKENWDDLKISYTEFLPYLKKLIYISLKYNIRITFDTVPACIFYKIDKKNYKSLIKIFLWEDKDHIVEIDHVNNKDNFNWKERKKNSLKTMFEFCKKCEYYNVCEWVWKEYVEIYWENEFEPIERKLVMLRWWLWGHLSFRYSFHSLLNSWELDNWHIDIIINSVMYFLFEDLFKKLEKRNNNINIIKINNFLEYEWKYLNWDLSIEDSLYYRLSISYPMYSVIYVNDIATSSLLWKKLRKILNDYLLLNNWVIKSILNYDFKFDRKEYYKNYWFQPFLKKSVFKDKFNFLNKNKFIILDMFTSDTTWRIKNIWFKNWKQIYSFLIEKFPDKKILLIGKTCNSDIFNYWEEISIKNENVINLINKTTLEEYFYILYKWDVIITHDSLWGNFSYVYNKKLVLFALPNVFEAINNLNNLNNLNNRLYDYSYSEINIPYIQESDWNVIKKSKFFIEIYNIEHDDNIIILMPIKNSMQFLKIDNNIKKIIANFIFSNLK